MYVAKVNESSKRILFEYSSPEEAVQTQHTNQQQWQPTAESDSVTFLLCGDIFVVLNIRNCILLKCINLPIWFFPSSNLHSNDEKFKIEIIFCTFYRKNAN